MIIAGKPALVLAPMDGVTDAFMRRFLTERMPFSFCVSEFIRISQIVPPARVFTNDVPELKSGARTASGAPVVVQLLGGDPERLAQSALVAVQAGAQVIDLNFGCPAPTVNRHDGGATLLKFPERIQSIVSAVRCGLPEHIPLSAKLRLGWDDPKAIFQNAERAVKGGAAWITIHGRTKMQGYTPPAYWKPIGEVRKMVGVPVVANGEIWNLEDLKRCQEQSGCEHLMIGRGALADPGLVKRCAEYLGIADTRSIAKSTKAAEDTDWRLLLRELTAESRAAMESDRRTMSRIKQWLNYAHKRGMVSCFDQVKRARDTKEFSDIISRLPIDLTSADCID
jgi:tRNA-dihydrouridine synthase C